MALLNAKAREIEAKLVYYGTALGGKTTNLLALHSLAEPDQKQKLVSLNTAGDRTLFFDLLPFELGKILDWRIRLKLYSIPGQAEYNETRRVVLANTDAIVFVADSTPARAVENVRAVNFFKLNCQQNQLDADTIPLVFQYNKRDLPGALPTTSLEGDLNWRRAPYFIATAVRGGGVIETFEEAVCQLTQKLLERFAPRGRGTPAEELRAAIHERLAPLYSRRAKWEEKTKLAPGGSSRHYVVVSDPASAPAAESRPLDTQDLLKSSIENEMRLLNEMFDRDAAANTAKEQFGLDPVKLARTLQLASRSRDIEAAAAPFLDWACEETGAARGSVLLLTPGDGRLAEAARHQLDSDPLNLSTVPGLPPASRRLALGQAPIYAPELVRIAYGTALVGANVPQPQAALPLLSLGAHLGLLALYAPTGTPPLAPDCRAVLEAIASVLALVLAVRALERRTREARPAEPVSRMAGPALVGAGGHEPGLRVRTP